jgi:hypothetical protein
MWAYKVVTGVSEEYINSIFRVGGYTLSRNVGNYLQDYAASERTTLQDELSTPAKLENSPRRSQL